MAVEVRITAGALRQLAALHEPIVARVNRIIERLADWPDVSGAKPLRGSMKGSFRVRTGDWRIVFRVTGDVLLVSAISNRRDAYED
jgi:mRNA interferase RelE/StbE